MEGFDIQTREECIFPHMAEPPRQKKRAIKTSNEIRRTTTAPLNSYRRWRRQSVTVSTSAGSAYRLQLIEGVGRRRTNTVENGARVTIACSVLNAW